MADLTGSEPPDSAILNLSAGADKVDALLEAQIKQWELAKRHADRQIAELKRQKKARAST